MIFFVKSCRLKVKGYAQETFFNHLTYDLVWSGKLKIKRLPSLPSPGSTRPAAVSLYGRRQNKQARTAGGHRTPGRSDRSGHSLNKIWPSVGHTDKDIFSRPSAITLMGPSEVIDPIFNQIGPGHDQFSSSITTEVTQAETDADDARVLEG
jgi:hypothetical protein